jgi:hypothetical protein
MATIDLVTVASPDFRGNKALVLSAADTEHGRK